MTSSGMLRRVALVRTDVSKELRASFISVTRIGELEIRLAVSSNRRRGHRVGPSQTRLFPVTSVTLLRLQFQFRLADIVPPVCVLCRATRSGLCTEAGCHEKVLSGLDAGRPVLKCLLLL
jgi:hypothetical protein